MNRIGEMDKGQHFALATKTRALRGAKVHLIGIAGVGMARLALILARLGCEVSGSDFFPERNPFSPQFEPFITEQGFFKSTIHKGHKAENLPEGNPIVVFSSAVPNTNPELVSARARGLRVLRRGQMLAELTRLFTSIVVCGAHGKTSTTALLHRSLDCDSINPSLYLGGTLVDEKHRWELHASSSEPTLGEIFVVESDESDRSFLETHPTFAIVTNIDREHLDSYQSFEELTDCFLQFVNRVPLYGLAIIGWDSDVARSILPKVQRDFVTYGLKEGADWRATNISIAGGNSCFEVWYQDRYQGQVLLPLVGEHMVTNSLAAFAFADAIGVPFAEVARRLEGFQGVHRRCEFLGTIEGASLLSDYAHHPVEVEATLGGLRKSWGERVHVIFQPHRYSRTKACWKEYLQSFRDAASVTLLDIYSAGESSVEGIDAESLTREIDHPRKMYIRDSSILKNFIHDLVRHGDVVVCMGAGSIDRMARELVL